jgi:DNA-binding transcriptional MerR regulator
LLATRAFPRIFSMSAANAPTRVVNASAPDPSKPVYSISDLAQEFALTTRAIRFYEDEGLLAPRRRGQTRIYGERERTRIKLILRGKRLGLALSEIRELFDIYATAGNERPQLAKFLQMLTDRRAMLHQQREDIDAVLAEIAFLERDCRRRLKQESLTAAPGPKAAGDGGGSPFGPSR